MMETTSPNLPPLIPGTLYLVATPLGKRMLGKGQQFNRKLITTRHGTYSHPS